MHDSVLACSIIVHTFRYHYRNVTFKAQVCLYALIFCSLAHDMITSNILSPSGSTQTTATSHNNFSSSSNQPSSRYPIQLQPNISPYNSFPHYSQPVQQPVLPPNNSHSSYPTTLQQCSNPTLAPAPSDFSPSATTNPVHLNQQYSVLPSHTNTPILHQNPSLSYEQHPLPSHSSGPPHPYHHRLSRQSFPLYSSTDPNSVTTAAATATSHHSLNPPDVHSLTSQFTSMTTPSEKTKTPKHSQSDSTKRSSSSPYRTKQSSLQKSFPPHHPRQSNTSIHDSTISGHHSLAPPSPPATTHPDVTASPSIQAHQHPFSSAMQRYVAYLKNVYKTKKTPVYDKEHSLLQVKAKYFINIALVHKDSPQYMKDSVRNEMIMDRLHGHVDVIQGTKTNLDMCDVCKSQDGGLAHSVLVEGAPGVGKTTFAYELCKRWARGEILQEWPVVVIIKLRDHRTRTAQNMYDLLYHPDPEIRQAVADLIRQDGKGMLMMLDGYDELTDKQREETSVIQQVMNREILMCQATVMVTSRPLATRSLHDNFKHSIDQHIELLGFTEKNITKYIKSACGDKPELVEDFKSYLSSHPFSSALMFNPLQCAIVTDLYRSHWESGDKGFAPKTLTELYTGLVHIMLLRYLTQHPVYKHRDWWVKDLSDLPEEVSQQLKAVTELAAEGIRNQQYVFDEVNTNIPSETLGFLQKEEVVASGIGMFASHNFLHLTLQEYLAAVSYSQQCRNPELLSQLLTQDDLFPLNYFFENYGKKRKYTLSSSATHWPVVLFVAGRTKLSGVPTNIFETGLYDSDYDDDMTIVNVSLLHLLYETQSPLLIQSTLVTSRKYLSVRGISALDWFVIGYCIASSNSVWEVRKEVKFSPKYFEKLFTGLRLGHKQGPSSGNGTIGSVHVGGYWSGNLMILLQLQPYAKTIRKIELVEQTLDETHVRMNTKKSTNNLKFSANYPMLEVFSIKDADASSFPSILSLILEQKNLHTLSMTNCTILTMPLICYLQSPNCSLNKLALLECTILNPDDHTQQITTVHSKDLALHSLCISWSVLDQMMSCINPFTQSLTELILCFDMTTHTCASEVETILQKLRYNCPRRLKTLRIGISFTEEVMLYDGSTRIYVDYDPRSCTSEVEKTLQKIPSNCPLLETLKIDINFDSKISFPFSIPQFIGSQQNNLHTLLLKWCTLSSDVIKSLICSLHSPHCKLYKLALYWCIIPTTDHTQLATAIVSSTTITHLLFIDENIDTPSLTALASGLKHNTTIEQLVVENYSKHFTEDQFQVLIDAVDSSAIKNLWLYDCRDYKKWLSDCILSRKNVNIVLCYNYEDVFNKW